MANAPETPIPAPSAGLVARLAAHLGLTAPVEAAPVETPVADTALADLQSKFDSLQAGFDAATVNAVALSEQVTALTAERDAAQGILNAIEALVPNIKDGPAAAIEAAVIKQSVEIVAASGFKAEEAPAVDPNAANEPTAMALADFNKLGTPEKNAFMQQGGKLK